MMPVEISLTTPALLFPAISLLLLAYTNRFLTLAGLVRRLHEEYTETQHPVLAGQILNLRRRIRIIQWMQALGIGSFLLCVVTMFMLFVGQLLPGEIVFGAALLLMMGSLTLSAWEIKLSIGALELQLSDMERPGEED
ncbi:MAG: DUF2721 domain-containing protein [Spirochaetaceae bacterium]